MLKNFNLENEGTEIKLENDQRLVTKKGEITPILRSNFTFRCYYEIPQTEEGIRIPLAVGRLRWFWYAGLLKEKMNIKKAQELTKTYFENNKRSLEGYLHEEIEVTRPFVYKKNQRSKDWRVWNAFETKGIVYRISEERK